MSIKFLLLFWVFWGGGGGECRFYFCGREDFSDLIPDPPRLAFFDFSLLFRFPRFSLLFGGAVNLKCNPEP